MLRPQLRKNKLVRYHDGNGLFIWAKIGCFLATRFSVGSIAMCNVHMLWFHPFQMVDEGYPWTFLKKSHHDFPGWRNSLQVCGADYRLATQCLYGSQAYRSVSMFRLCWREVDESPLNSTVTATNHPWKMPNDLVFDELWGTTTPFL